MLFLSERLRPLDEKIRWRLRQAEQLIEDQRRFRVIHFVVLDRTDVAGYNFGRLSEALVVGVSDRLARDRQVELLARQLRVPGLPSTAGYENHAETLGGACLVDLILEGSWAQFGAIDRINIERDIAGQSYNLRSPRIASTSTQGKDAVRITLLAEKSDLPGLANVSGRLLAGKKVLQPPQVRPFLARAVSSLEDSDTA